MNAEPRNSIYHSEQFVARGTGQKNTANYQLEPAQVRFDALIPRTARL